MPSKASILSISTTLSLTETILQRLKAIRFGRTGARQANTPGERVLGIASGVNLENRPLLRRVVSVPSAFQRRLQRAQTFLDVTLDIFQHDDGIVDNKANGDRQTHERQIIEAEAGEVHQGEGANQRQAAR